MTWKSGIRVYVRKKRQRLPGTFHLRTNDNGELSTSVLDLRWHNDNCSLISTKTSGKGIIGVGDLQERLLLVQRQFSYHIQAVVVRSSAHLQIMCSHDGENIL
jgi:hypothetical protein